MMRFPIFLMAAASLLVSPVLVLPVLAAEAPTQPAQTQENWALHGQITAIEQYHPPFHALFRGPNSMDSGSRGDETVNASLFGGVRPWDGGEAWADLEMDQGFGLSNTLGAAGFPNGQGSKVGKALPYLRLQRLFFRQSFNLGGDSQAIEAGAGQFGGARDADNLVVTLGKFAVTDIFDVNQYAHDATSDFLNWAVIDAGAFDFAADAWGYSYGAAMEWSLGSRTLRGGLFDMSRVPNGTELVRGLGQYQVDAELEQRLSLFGRDGKIKLLAFVSRARMGTYKDAVLLGAATHTSPNTLQVEKPYSRPGVSLNIEQGLSDDLGMFLRLTDTDGAVESYEFTDMDASIQGGLSLKGNFWSRPADVVGLALESGEISKSAQAYFAAGGLGILIGDGRLLHYDNEDVMEAFYNIAVAKGITATADYQLIANPAYNADRGPISVLGIRLHGEF